MKFERDFVLSARGTLFCCNPVGIIPGNQVCLTPVASWLQTHCAGPLQSKDACQFLWIPSKRPSASTTPLPESQANSASRRPGLFSPSVHRGGLPAPARALRAGRGFWPSNYPVVSDSVEIEDSNPDWPTFISDMSGFVPPEIYTNGLADRIFIE